MTQKKLYTVVSVPDDYKPTDTYDEFGLLKGFLLNLAYQLKARSYLPQTKEWVEGKKSIEQRFLNFSKDLFLNYEDARVSVDEEQKNIRDRTAEMEKLVTEDIDKKRKQIENEVAPIKKQLEEKQKERQSYLGDYAHIIENMNSYLTVEQAQINALTNAVSAYERLYTNLNNKTGIVPMQIFLERIEGLLNKYKPMLEEHKQGVEFVNGQMQEIENAKTKAITDLDSAINEFTQQEQNLYEGRDAVVASQTKFLTDFKTERNKEINQLEQRMKAMNEDYPNRLNELNRREKQDKKDLRTEIEKKLKYYFLSRIPRKTRKEIPLEEIVSKPF